MLKQIKIPIFDSDKEVKEILENNDVVKKKICNLWPDVIQIEKNDKKIDKSLLGNKIFSNMKYRKILESIIHPQVEKRRNNFIKSEKNSYIVALDIPLLYETGIDKICDYIFLVHAKTKIQKKRVLARPRMTEEKFILINKVQWDYQKKKEKGPYLITTSYGKLISVIIIISHLSTILFKEKILKS